MGYKVKVSRDQRCFFSRSTCPDDTTLRKTRLEAFSTFPVQKSDSGVRRVLSIVANKWTTLVIHRLASGSKRPMELMQSIEGISQKMLTQTLRRMERGGLVSRKVYAVVPPRVDYTLTSLGLTLVEPVNVFRRWAREHRAEIESWEARHGAIRSNPKADPKRGGARKSTL